MEGHHANPSLELPRVGAHRPPSRDSLQTLQGWWKPLQLHRHHQSFSIPCALTSCLSFVPGCFKPHVHLWLSPFLLSMPTVCTALISLSQGSVPHLLTSSQPGPAFSLFRNRLFKDGVNRCEEGMALPGTWCPTRLFEAVSIPFFPASQLVELLSLTGRVYPLGYLQHRSSLRWGKDV